MDASRTTKLTVGLRSARGEEERENAKREKSDHGSLRFRKDGTDEESRGGDHGSRTGVVDWRTNVAQVID